MIDVYRSVYRLRQLLLSLKEGLEMKASARMDANCEQSLADHSNFSDTEEEALQTKVSGISTPVQSKHSFLLIRDKSIPYAFACTYKLVECFLSTLPYCNS